MNRSDLRRSAAPTAAALALALGLAACGGQDQSGGNSPNGGDSAALSGTVRVDGSSTVQPLSSAAAELYAAEQPDVNVTVGASGTSGGFESFCAGKTDISDASRPIEAEEVQACKKEGVDFTEMQVAVDALTVVVNPGVDFVDCLTVEQLKKIWEPAAEGKITDWSQVDPSFPDMPLKLFGPGTDSGTYEYFAEEIVGAEEATRTDYEPSEDDNVLVEGVAGTDGAMGYFGYTYYEENQEQLKALAIDSGDGCVEPAAETAQAGEYTPLSRPLFIYVSNKSYSDQPQVAGYVDFYIDNLPNIVEQAQYISMSEEQLAKTEDTLASLGSS